MSANDSALPTDLHPLVAVGDKVEFLVRLTDGSAFWGGTGTVKRVDDQGRPWVRFRHGKVDKTYPEWRIVK